MKPHSLSRFVPISLAKLSIALSVLSLWSSSVGFAEDEQLRKYKDIWAAQRPKVESGIIHYKQFAGGDFKMSDRDEVRLLLKTISEGRQDFPAKVRDLACKLTGVEVPPIPTEYPDCVLYFKNDKLRYERYEGIEIYDGNQRIESRHGQVNNPSLQITIGNRQGQVLMRQMDGLPEFYSV